MFNKDSTNIDEIRGGVLSSFATLEVILDGAIAGEYFMDSDESMHYRFIDEVLSQELFSFELKKRILYKMLKANYADLYATFPKVKLDRLQNLRNIIAHSIHGQTASPALVNDARSMSFYNAGKEHKCIPVYKEYCELYDEVELSIRMLPKTYVV